MLQSSEWLSNKATYYELSKGSYNFYIASRQGYGTSLHTFPHTFFICEKPYCLSCHPGLSSALEQPEVSWYLLVLPQQFL